jgi:hypothetical protein
MPDIWMRLLREQLALLYLWRIWNVKLLLMVLTTCSRQLLENNKRWLLLKLEFGLLKLDEML